MKDTSLKQNILTFLGAMLCCLLWGSAFPCIKIGYSLWSIDTGDTWSIVEFAGLRFLLAGLLVIIFGGIISRKILLPKVREIGPILFLSLFQTIGQYVFFYLGLANTSGVNSAVVDSLTTFFAILMASLIFRMEKLTLRKILGCIIGFAGVTLINLSGQGFHINLLGDGLVALSALCYGVSSCLIKRYSDEHDTVTFSGYQFMFGGIVMIVISLVARATYNGTHDGSSLGQNMLIRDGIFVESGIDSVGKALLMLLYLAIISSVAYTLWGILLRNNDVSKISIFGFMNPVFGVLLSAILLGEYGQMGWRYVISLILVSIGIIVVNKKCQPERIEGS